MGSGSSFTISPTGAPWRWCSRQFRLVGDEASCTEPFATFRREAIVSVDHPTRGPIKMPGWPVKMECSHVRIEAAPLLGQHNLEVYEELLGLGEAELAQLAEQGVI